MKTNKLKKSAAYFIAGIIIAGIFLNGCLVEPEAEDEYYYEHFRISRVNYNSVRKPSFVTFESNFNFRNELWKYYIAGSGANRKNLTQKGLSDFLMDYYSFSPVEVNSVISELNKTGNLISVDVGTSECFIVYIERY